MGGEPARTDQGTRRLADAGPFFGPERGGLMELFLEPVDVWLFRDGRPFDALSDHRAESIFPPYPTVMQGAIRSHHLVVKGVDLSDRAAIEAAVGTATDFKGLRLRGPFIAK